MNPHPNPAYHPNADESARRAYWTEMMEYGYDIVQKLIAFPVQECGERFASLREAAAAAGVEMLFSQSKIAGDLDRIFFLRESLVRDVVEVGREMNARGWVLKIEDGFRTLEMQQRLLWKPGVFDAILAKCIWENGGKIPPVELVFRRAVVLIANIPKIGTHMSGSAIDVSVFGRADGAEVWRGNPYLEMSERTPMRSPFVEPEYIRNRLEITEMLEAHGLLHFPCEFWHFNKGDAGAHILSGNAAPCRYGPVNWDPVSNTVQAIENPNYLLNPLPVIQGEIDAAVARAAQAGRAHA